MASSIPEQLRAVDPYASYNSNVVNQLTGIVTRGSNALDFYNSLQVIPDSTSAIDHVQVLPGIIYKDDMLIEITSPHRVDFTDPTQYISASGDPFNAETGNYYVVLEYTYIKSRPAPQARIKILLPSQTANFRAGQFPALFFLKAVEVLVIGTIAELYDYDPLYPTTRREYLRNYASSEINLPPHDQARDQSRIAYNPIEDQFYLGYSDRWGPAGATGFLFEADTSLLAIGDLVYINSLGTLSKAIMDSTAILSTTEVDGVVIKVDTLGLVQTVGKVFDVPIESGNSVSKGDLLYLSESEAGTITKDITSPFSQFVGRSLAADSTSSDILFVRGDRSGTVWG